jgi:hypothetical protein
VSTVPTEREVSELDAIRKHLLTANILLFTLAAVVASSIHPAAVYAVVIAGVVALAARHG